MIWWFSLSKLFISHVYGHYCPYRYVCLTICWAYKRQILTVLPLVVALFGNESMLKCLFWLPYWCFSAITPVLTHLYPWHPLMTLMVEIIRQEQRQRAVKSNVLNWTVRRWSKKKENAARVVILQVRLFATINSNLNGVCNNIYFCTDQLLLPGEHITYCVVDGDVYTDLSLVPSDNTSDPCEVCHCCVSACVDKQIHVALAWCLDNWVLMEEFSCIPCCI